MNKEELESLRKATFECKYEPKDIETYTAALETYIMYLRITLNRKPLQLKLRSI